MVKKSILLLTAAVLTAALAVACKDDRHGGGDDGGSGSGKQLTKLTLVQDGFTELVAELTWDGSLLDRVLVKECTGNGQFKNLGYAEPSYNNRGLMGSILLHSYEEGGNDDIFLSYNNRDQLSAIELPNGESVTLDWNSQGFIYDVHYGNEHSEVEWSGSNPTRISDGDGQYIRLKYNTISFPLNELLASAGVAIGLNCPTSITDFDGEEISISYTSDGGYPSVATLSDGEGESIQIYFQYADGTGGTPPAPVASTYIYFHAYGYSGGYVEDQDGHRDTEMRYAIGSTLTLRAVPYSGYSFSGWSDGNMQNPRTITVNSNTTEYAAIFTSGGGSTSGNSVSFNYSNWNSVNVLYFTYNSHSNTLYGMLFESNSDVLTSNSVPWMYISLTNLVYGSNYYSVNTETGWIDDDYSSIEYCNSSAVSNNFSGDWWGKSVYVDVTSYNFGTHTFSLNLYGTFYDFRAYWEENTPINQCATRWVDVTLTNVSFTESSGSKLAIGKTSSQSLEKRQVNKKKLIKSTYKK